MSVYGAAAEGDMRQAQGKILGWAMLGAKRLQSDLKNRKSLKIWRKERDSNQAQIPYGLALTFQRLPDGC
jgi:hypothetical protein